jgi:hypothetical protein
MWVHPTLTWLTSQMTLSVNRLCLSERYRGGSSSLRVSLTRLFTAMSNGSESVLSIFWHVLTCSARNVWCDVGFAKVPSPLHTRTTTPRLPGLAVGSRHSPSAAKTRKTYKVKQLLRIPPCSVSDGDRLARYNPRARPLLGQANRLFSVASWRRDRYPRHWMRLGGLVPKRAS